MKISLHAWVAKFKFAVCTFPNLCSFNLHCCLSVCGCLHPTGVRSREAPVLSRYDCRAFYFTMARGHINAGGVDLFPSSELISDSNLDCDCSP